MSSSTDLSSVIQTIGALLRRLRWSGVQRRDVLEVAVRPVVAPGHKHPHLGHAFVPGDDVVAYITARSRYVPQGTFYTTWGHFVNKITKCAILGAAHGEDALRFPDGFKFGVASAAYQVEGAWNVSDKSESIWDRFSHDHPEHIAGGVTGDVACDSYHLWERDIEMIKEIGAHFYRFSISWPRLLPSGFSDRISEDGSRYYNQLIDGLVANGIEPVITLYHWDLPQRLQDMGGWTNPLIAEWFGDYARVAFYLFGDRVKTWVTLNEPTSFCDITYMTGGLAPGIYDPIAAPYLCNKHTLMAHATAWRIYDKEFRSEQNGKVGIVNHFMWFEALQPEYEELAELSRQYMIGRYSHAIFSKEGGWPSSLVEAFEEKSKAQGFPNLPPFTEEEIDFIRGTFDYFGVNHYTTKLILPAEENDILEPYPVAGIPDLDAKLVTNEDWPPTASSWFFVYPPGIRRQLNWLRQQYGNIEFIIMENGYPTTGGLDDQDRVSFYKDYLEQVLLAIKDGVNVTGYTAWTLMDNFEWLDGYSSQFGLYQVDFSSPSRTREPRSSVFFYNHVIKAHSLNVPKDFEPYSYKNSNDID